MEDLPLQSQIARAMREAAGMGMRDAHLAMRDAEENLDGDYVLAALARHAHGFAISIRSDDPDVSPEQARRIWDLKWARSDLANGLRPGWEEFARLAELLKPDVAGKAS